MKNHTSYELDRIMDKAVDIFSSTRENKDILRTWIKENHSDEIRPLCRAFKEVGEKLHHKWAGALLAVLPEDSWDVLPNGLTRINTDKVDASLRFLSKEVIDEEESDAILLTAARKELLTRLLEEMPVAKRSAYRPMLEWCERPQEDLTFGGDTRFGIALEEIEFILNEMFHMQELEWRKLNSFKDSDSTPHEKIVEFSFVALRQLTYFLERCCNEPVHDVAPPESLMALTSANMSCNRILLERAALTRRSQEAEKMCTNFMRELNKKGINEVPLEIDSAGPAKSAKATCKKEDDTHEKSEKVFHDLLKKWFAYGGTMLKAGSYFSRHMTNTEIDLIVKWSKELQDDYMDGRGSSGGSEKAIESHGGTCNRFIFAMTLCAAFYNHATTQYEIRTTKRKNSLYAIFPSRLSIANNDTNLPKHAKEALLHAYGQIYFSNVDWSLHADNVARYCEATNSKKDMFILGINFAVKSRSCQQLVALFERLVEFRDSPEKAWARMGRSRINSNGTQKK